MTNSTDPTAPNRDTVTPEKMCTPRQMFDQLGWLPPRNVTNRATSWDDLMDAAGERYETNKRLRQGLAA